MGVYTRSQSAAAASRHSIMTRPQPESAVAEAPATITAPADLASPFGKVEGLDRDDFRMAAYEIFFTSCRSSPGFGGGRNSLGSYPSESGDFGSGPGSPSAKGQGVGMAVTSRVKMALGLKMLRRSPSRRNSSGGSNPSSPHGFGHGFSTGFSPGFGMTVPVSRSRRPLTSAEIMRLQMRVTELSDNRLRKTLMRTLVGQYIVTGQVEPDLLGATLAMLAEVANDAKRVDREPVYVKMLASALVSIKRWSEKRLVDYHASFQRGKQVGLMETILPLVFSTTKILEEDVPGFAAAAQERNGGGSLLDSNSYGIRVDHYIRSSLRNAFAKMIEEGSVNAKNIEEQAVSEALLKLAQETEDLAYKEKELFSGILKKWHPLSAGVAAMTLHSCYGTLLKQYLAGAKTWNPKSKHEPYAHSAVELMKHAREAVEDFFQIPIAISEDLIYDLADGLEQIFRDYTAFAASCGSKQSYLPTLPPLTRCNRDSKLFKLWRKASPCSVVVEDGHHPVSGSAIESHHPRPSTSRGTQRLYIRINTLHYLLSQLHSLDKTISLSPRVVASARNSHRQLSNSFSYFDHTHSAIPMAYQHVSEVAAYRLIFLDSSFVFYGSLYVGDVENARIRPVLRILKQNLTLLTAIVTDRAQPLAIKDVMKASFEAYLMVLLAGGNSRIFNRLDHEMIEEDFESLKRVFCTCGEGFMPEDVVDREAETLEGVVALMGQSTEQIIEDFSIVACEASGISLLGSGQKLPMPPTTGRWKRTDPNTILRVICHRNDALANQFLKRTFQLAKRR
ncbi:hypothetical protein LguiA_001414 [Lonicera macranthoides]